MEAMQHSFENIFGQTTLEDFKNFGDHFDQVNSTTYHMITYDNTNYITNHGFFPLNF